MVIWSISCKIYGSTSSCSMAIYIWKRFNNIYTFNLYLYFEEGLNFYKIIKKLVNQITRWMWSWSSNDFFYLFNNEYNSCDNFIMFSGYAFFYCITCFLFFKERISFNVWISIILATIGIIIMALGNTEKSSVIGFIFGITSSIGFSVFL